MPDAFFRLLRYGDGTMWTIAEVSVLVGLLIVLGVCVFLVFGAGIGDGSDDA